VGFLQKQLVLTNRKMNRVAAQQYAKRHKKKLASHLLADRAILEGSLTRLTWVREWLVYPKSRGIFQKKRDIIDGQTGCILPWEFVKGKDVFRKNVALFVDPKNLRKSRKTRGTTLIPESITILENFPQNGERLVCGKADEETAIPLIVPANEWGNIIEWRRRKIFRARGQAVVPISRGYEGFFGSEDRYVVNACFQTRCLFWVALEAESPAQQAGAQA
jgi:hypothetical protein